MYFTLRTQLLSVNVYTSHKHIVERFVRFKIDDNKNEFSVPFSYLHPSKYSYYITTLPTSFIEYLTCVHKRIHTHRTKHTLGFLPLKI